MRYAAVLLVIAACYSPPTTTAAPRSAMAVNASFDRTWTAVIDVFADRNVPIRTLDRTSGFVATDELRVGSEGADWADCGSGAGGTIGPAHAGYNVRIR